MEFRLLGPLEVVEHQHALDLGASKQRALFALLLLHANEVVATARLIDELWPEAPPRTASKNVQVYVSGLRKQLGDGRLVTRTPGYMPRVDPGQLDVARFEGLLAEARGAAPEPQQSGCAKRSPCGAGRRSPTSRTSASRSRRSRDWRGCASPRSSSGSTPTSRPAATPSSSASSRRSSPRTRCASARAAS